MLCCSFFFQAEDGIRYLVRSRGLGDVYKRQTMFRNTLRTHVEFSGMADNKANIMISINTLIIGACLLYTSDAADERSSVDLGGRRIIQQKKNT